MSESSTPLSSSVSENKSSMRRAEESKKSDGIITAPDKLPKIRWHRKNVISWCRFGRHVILFVSLLLLSVLLGPTAIAFLYPSIGVPYFPRLEWKCISKTAVHLQIHDENRVLATDLMASSAPVRIELYLTDSDMKLDELGHVLLVVDNCHYDYTGTNVLLCQPLMNREWPPSFKKYVQMVANCYHYIRQITRHTRISGYGRGIAANVLLAAAAQLRRDSCYHFDNLYIEDPIPEILTEFRMSTLTSLMFSIPRLRQKMIEKAAKEYGWHLADASENMKKIGETRTIMVMEKMDPFSVTMVDLGAQKLSRAHFKNELKAHAAVSPPKSAFDFRHQREEICASDLKVSVNLLQVANWNE